MREEIENTTRMSEGRIQKILEDQNSLRDQLSVKEEQFGESRVIADRLREQIRMLEESGQGTSDEVVVRLEAERSDMEQKLLDWNKWADEVTAQLAERDATIADLMSAREHLDDSLRQAEELRNRVAELESTAVERDKNLSDDSPIGRTLDHREENAEELEKANNEIALLREELRKAGTKSPGVVSPEEAEVLLDAYRAEIDRLSKENSKLRTEVKKAAPPPDHPAKSSSSTNSWWNVLPDIEEPEGLDDLNK
jgi:chromosome segregation ATPase